MWAVRYETRTTWPFSPSLVEYRYWRWRWLARLSVWLHRLPAPGPILLLTEARLLGRVRRRELPRAA